MAETQTAAKERRAARTADEIAADFAAEDRARRWRNTKRDALKAVAVLTDGIRSAESTVDLGAAMSKCIAAIDALIPEKCSG